jgi:hypothetical protein
MDDRIDKFMCELGIGDDMETVLLEAIGRISALEAERAAVKAQLEAESDVQAMLRSDLALTVGQLQERAEWDEAHKRAADWEEGISA